MIDVVKKLRYKGQSPVLVANEPDEAKPLLDELEKQGAQIAHSATGSYGFILVFARSMAEATEVAKVAADALEGDGIIWFCYPKGTSKRYKDPDVNRDKTWELFEPYGLRPVAQVALDDDWSAVRVRRQEFAGS